MAKSLAKKTAATTKKKTLSVAKEKTVATPAEKKRGRPAQSEAEPIKRGRGRPKSATPRVSETGYIDPIRAKGDTRAFYSTDERPGVWSIKALPIPTKGDVLSLIENNGRFRVLNGGCGGYISNVRSNKATANLPESVSFDCVAQRYGTEYKCRLFADRTLKVVRVNDDTEKFYTKEQTIALCRIRPAMDESPAPAKKAVKVAKEKTVAAPAEKKRGRPAKVETIAAPAKKSAKVETIVPVKKTKTLGKKSIAEVAEIIPAKKRGRPAKGSVKTMPNSDKRAAAKEASIKTKVKTKKITNTVEEDDFEDDGWD